MRYELRAASCELRATSKTKTGVGVSDLLDQIHITDLVVSGIVGINADERVNRQEIRVNATFWVDTRPAATSDNIDDAVNYRTITKRLIAHIETGEPMLVERLTAELVEICFESDPRIAEVEMTVEKPGALRHARSVGITIHRNRNGGSSDA